MKQKRGYRRQQVSRWKRRVRSYYGGVHADDARSVGCLSKTRTPCSCWMCGNPRRYFGDVTLQERRALLAETED